QRPAVYNALGEIFQRKGAWEESISAYSQAIALNPNLASAHANLGSIYLGQGRWEAALGSYEEAINHDPKLHETLRPRMAEAWGRLGQELWREGKDLEALSRLEKALSLEPGRISDLKAMAQTCYEQGKPEAERYLAAVLSLDPNWGEAYLALADLYLKQGKTREAMGSLEKAVTIYPDRAELHYHLGLLYEREGRKGEAALELKRAVERDPQLSPAWARLGEIALGRGGWEEAISNCETAIKCDPNLSSNLMDVLFRAHSQMALSLHEQGKLDAAESHYLKALVLQGPESSLLCNLGNLYREKGELKKAEEAYRSALQASPGWAKAHMGLALLAETRKDWQTALYEWRLFLEQEPRSESAGQIRERIEKISSALNRAGERPRSSQ
ncbi:MAG: tetratricopeptide repeat protein, partial [bacterium]